MGQSRVEEEDDSGGTANDPLLLSLECMGMFNIEADTLHSHTNSSQGSVFLTMNSSGIFFDFGLPSVEAQSKSKLRNQSSQSSDLFHQVHHLDGGEGSVEAFVPALGAGTFDRLFDVVGGEDAKNDRYARFKSYVRNPF
jgi:hypothetical protein